MNAKILPHMHFISRGKMPGFQQVIISKLPTIFDYVYIIKINIK